MSSILKALKKLETESPGHEIQGQHIPRSINTRQTVNKRVKGFWIVNKLFSIMCIVIITLGIAWFVLNYKSAYKSNHAADIAKSSAEKHPEVQHQEKSAESSDVLNKIAKKTETVISEPEKEIKNVYSSVPYPAQNIDKAKTVPGPLPVITEKKVQTPMPVPKQKEQIKPVPKEMPKPPVTAAVTVKKPIKPPAVSHEEQEPEKEKQTSLSEPQTDKTPAKDAHDLIPEKSASESGLEIQALVWSPEPGSRMAVINGNILREGGTIEGAVINYIGNDYIIFKKQSKEWKLIFQIN